MKLRPLKCFCKLFPNYVQGRTKVHRLYLPYDPKIKEVIPDPKSVINMDYFNYRSIILVNVARRSDQKVHTN